MGQGFGDGLEFGFAIAAEVRLFQASKSRQVLGHLLEDRGLPQKGARTFAACSINHAEPLVDPAPFLWIFAGTCLLEQCFGQVRRGRPAALCVALGRDPPQWLRHAHAGGACRIASSGLVISGACALERGLDQEFAGESVRAITRQGLSPGRTSLGICRQ